MSENFDNNNVEYGRIFSDNMDENTHNIYEENDLSNIFDYNNNEQHVAFEININQPHEVSNFDNEFEKPQEGILDKVEDINAIRESNYYY
jgi:hypothetical protein